MGIFPGSSMVEQEAVNFEVAGSSPAPGARLDEGPFFCRCMNGSNRDERTVFCLILRLESRRLKKLVLVLLSSSYEGSRFLCGYVLLGK